MRRRRDKTLYFYYLNHSDTVLNVSSISCSNFYIKLGFTASFAIAFVHYVTFSKQWF